LASEVLGLTHRLEWRGVPHQVGEDDVSEDDGVSPARDDGQPHVVSVGKGRSRRGETGPGHDQNDQGQNLKKIGRNKFYWHLPLITAGIGMCQKYKLL
jgi:hypothetical protein